MTSHLEILEIERIDSRGGGREWMCDERSGTSGVFFLFKEGGV